MKAANREIGEELTVSEFIPFDLVLLKKAAVLTTAFLLDLNFSCVN